MLFITRRLDTTLFNVYACLISAVWLVPRDRIWIFVNSLTERIETSTDNPGGLDQVHLFCVRCQRFDGCKFLVANMACEFRHFRISEKKNKIMSKVPHILGMVVVMR